jgi:hypothetical protein
MQPEALLETVCDDVLARDAVMDGVADTGFTVAALRWELSCVLGSGLSSTVTLEAVAGDAGLEDAVAGGEDDGGCALFVFGALQAESRVENINTIQVRSIPGGISSRILTPELVSDQKQPVPGTRSTPNKHSARLLKHPEPH